MTPANFEDHILFQRLNSIDEVLSAEDSKRKIGIEKLSFFQVSASFINQRVNLVLPELIQIAEMDGLSSELNAAVTYINNFVETENESHLNNAVNHFNAAISKAKNLAIPVNSDGFDFSKKIANFENTVSDKYKDLKKEKNELENEINSLRNDSAAQKNIIQELIEHIKGKSEEIENLSFRFQSKFDDIKTQHDQQFSTALKSYSAEVKQSKEQFRKEFDELKESANNNSLDLVDNLETKYDEARTLVGLIANVGITGNYQNIANDHKKDANLWRWVAVGFMAAFSIILLITIWNLNVDNLAWQQALVRIVAAISLSYPATYAARESSRHRKLETINRNAELELASINPFIEDLGVETKQKIKGELVEKYFGNHNNLEHSDAKELKGLSTENFEKVIEAISKIKKS